MELLYEMIVNRRIVLVLYIALYLGICFWFVFSLVQMLRTEKHNAALYRRRKCMMIVSLVIMQILSFLTAVGIILYIIGYGLSGFFR